MAVVDDTYGGGANEFLVATEAGVVCGAAGSAALGDSVAC